MGTERFSIRIFVQNSVISTSKLSYVWSSTHKVIRGTHQKSMSLEWSVSHFLIVWAHGWDRVGDVVYVVKTWVGEYIIKTTINEIQRNSTCIIYVSLTVSGMCSIGPSRKRLRFAVEMRYIIMILAIMCADWLPSLMDLLLYTFNATDNYLSSSLSKSTHHLIRSSVPNVLRKQKLRLELTMNLVFSFSVIFSISIPIIQSRTICDAHM